MEKHGDLNPFECPICFEFYSVINIPTTLPCGHSCCIIHVGNLSECFACRGNIGDIRALRPSYALRDGAVMVHSLTRDLEEKLSQLEELKIEIQTKRKRVVKKKANDDSLNDKENNLNVSVPNHLKFLYCPNSGCEESLTSQKSLVQHLKQCQYHSVVKYICSNRQCAKSFRSQKALLRHNQLCSTVTRPQSRKVGTNTISQETPTIKFSLNELKSCGHYCCPSSLAACCGCMDRRPMQPEGSYSRYVDTEGWKNIGFRRDGYCMTCRQQT